MIDWLLFNANSAIFLLYHGENKSIFNEMMMRSALYSTNTLSWIFIVLAHWNNSPQVHMSAHSYTLSWFWANPSSFCILSGEAINITFLSFGLTGSWNHDLPDLRRARSQLHHRCSRSSINIQSLHIYIRNRFSHLAHHEGKRYKFSM